MEKSQETGGELEQGNAAATITAGNISCEDTMEKSRQPIDSSTAPAAQIESVATAGKIQDTTDTDNQGGGSSGGGSGGATAEEESAATSEVVGAESLWMYLDGVNPTQHGPVTQAAMLKLLKTGSAHKDMMAWSQGMADWRPLGQVSFFTVVVVVCGAWAFVSYGSSRL